MVGSRFRGNIPHRPTPQTCYPPPPPPPDPGWVPCLGAPLNSIASLELSGKAIRPFGGPGEFVLTTAANMATVSKAPGLIQWQTAVTSAEFQTIQIGIRCIGTPYSQHEWQGLVIGNTKMPDGTLVPIVEPWGVCGANVQLIAPGNWHIRIPSTNASVIVNGWQLSNMHVTLIERPDTTRSRPPNPPIPWA